MVNLETSVRESSWVRRDSVDETAVLAGEQHVVMLHVTLVLKTSIGF